MLGHFPGREEMNLLIVDDHPLIVDGLVYRFSKQAKTIKVSTARNIEQALQAMTTKLFDVVLLDLNLPDSRGVASLIKMKDVLKKNKEVRVLIYSALDDPSTVRLSFKHGARGYIRKSDPFEEVLKVINYIVKTNYCAIPRDLAAGTAGSRPSTTSVDAVSPKTDEETRHLLRTTYHLNERDIFVLERLLNGSRIKIILEDWAAKKDKTESLSESTVHRTIRKIYSAFDVGSKGEFLEKWAQLGYSLKRKNGSQDD